MSIKRKSLLLLFLVCAMPVATPALLIWLFPDGTLHQKLIAVAIAGLIFIVTCGFTIRAIGEYQEKRWLSEAQDARERAAGGTVPQDAATVTPPTDALAPQPLGAGTIIFAGAVTSVVVARIAGAMLPHASKAFIYIVGIAAAVTVVHMLTERRKRQFLRQAGLDAPASAPQPRDEASV